MGEEVDVKVGMENGVYGVVDEKVEENGKDKEEIKVMDVDVFGEEVVVVEKIVEVMMEGLSEKVEDVKVELGELNGGKLVEVFVEVLMKDGEEFKVVEEVVCNGDVEKLLNGEGGEKVKDVVVGMVEGFIEGVEEVMKVEKVEVGVVVLEVVV